MSKQYKIERRKQQDLNRLKQRRIRLIMLPTIAVVIIIVMAIIFLNQKTFEMPYAAQPSLGVDTAPVKIVEFGDFKCPSCKAFNDQMMPKLKTDYIDTGIVKFHFMNYSFLGPDSMTLARAGESVYKQSPQAFWSFVDLIYKNQGNEAQTWGTPQFIVDLMKKEQIPINYELLAQDLQTNAYLKDVEEDMSHAKTLRISGTPSIFINGKKFENLFDYSALQKAITDAQKG